ncbi:MAG: 50S ribosomal protein L3 [Chloroflexi bacterium]|nr:MAG: 50S ribosomal protein L3 [Chloroflexota bacterium]RLC88564.1 MAG: 50S ribosomal protein L3 [Chloroflexota bacterium]
MKTILGKKAGMTQIFNDHGEAVPVTVIEAGPCYVTQVKTLEQDSYRAVQLGFEEVKPQRLSGGEKGHLAHGDLPTLRHLREFELRDEEIEEGQQVLVDIFEVGDWVDVVGTSKGRGFAGVVKRYGFGGGPKTHGQSDRQRAPGSIGACAYPGRVWKGKRMPGRMGGVRVTAQNLRVELVDPERNLLAVRGSVPGAKGGLLMVKQARKSAELAKQRGE